MHLFPDRNKFVWHGVDTFWRNWFCSLSYFTWLISYSKGREKLRWARSDVSKEYDLSMKWQCSTRYYVGLWGPSGHKLDGLVERLAECPQVRDLTVCTTDSIHWHCGCSFTEFSQSIERTSLSLLHQASFPKACKFLIQPERFSF